MDELERAGKAKGFFRARPELLTLCKQLNIDVSKEARAALAKAIRRRLPAQRVLPMSRVDAVLSRELVSRPKRRNQIK